MLLYELCADKDLLQQPFLHGIKLHNHCWVLEHGLDVPQINSDRTKYLALHVMRDVVFVWSSLYVPSDFLS